MVLPPEYIAFHEAGHAVVYWWLGRWFECVSIARRCVEGKGGIVLRAEVDAVIMCMLAGPLAEQYFARGGQLPAESGNAAANDEAQALEWARVRDEFAIVFRETDPRYGLTPEELAERLRALTRDLLGHAPLWSGVQAVARELLKRDPLSYDEVSAILENKGLVRGVPRELGPWFPRKGET